MCQFSACLPVPCQPASLPRSRFPVSANLWQSLRSLRPVPLPHQTALLGIGEVPQLSLSPRLSCWHGGRGQDRLTTAGTERLATAFCESPVPVVGGNGGVALDNAPTTSVQNTHPLEQMPPMPTVCTSQFTDTAPVEKDGATSLSRNNFLSA